MSALIVGSMMLFGGCASERATPQPPPMKPQDARAFIEQAMPRGVADRSGWANDIYAALTVLSIPPSRENSCAIVAIIAQESDFHVDPVIPGLGAIAWKEIEARAVRANVPKVVVRGVLQLKSSDGRSYSERIDSARTEHELSDIYEDFIGSVPLGRTLFENHNPIHTRGPMQVQVAFATQFAAAKAYPYPVKNSIDDELFTRRGGIYFGVAHLLDYAAPYDSYLYRFADFNAGRYASRNAAFQRAVATASGIVLVADGALLPHAGNVNDAGDTELAVRSLRSRLTMSDAAIHSALDQGKSREFASSRLYQRVFSLAEQVAGHSLPRAAMPQINLQGPKITRKLTTEWYAKRVDGRYQTCVNRRSE